MECAEQESAEREAVLEEKVAKLNERRARHIVRLWILRGLLDYGAVQALRAVQRMLRGIVAPAT